MRDLKILHRRFGKSASEDAIVSSASRDFLMAARSRTSFLKRRDANLQAPEAPDRMPPRFRSTTTACPTLCGKIPRLCGNNSRAFLANPTNLREIRGGGPKWREREGECGEGTAAGRFSLTPSAESVRSANGPIAPVLVSVSGVKAGSGFAGTAPNALKRCRRLRDTRKLHRSWRATCFRQRGRPRRSCRADISSFTRSRAPINPLVN